MSMSRSGSIRRSRSGRGVIELLIILVIVGFLAMVIVMGLTRSREQARLLACRANLAQIGLAVSLYDQWTGALPPVPEPEAETRFSPIATMMGRLGVYDFRELDPDMPRLEAGEGPVESATSVASLICPSDPVAISGTFDAPVSYRANTGDTVEGSGGPFAIGGSTAIAAIQAADGAEYTASFAERLVGSGEEGPDPLRDYQLVSGAVEPDCGASASPDRLERDAGRSWLEANWVSTLYTHARAPKGGPACIATDGRASNIGASSGHVDGIHVLTLDGRVQVVRPSVDPVIWKSLGNGFDTQSEPASVSEADPRADSRPKPADSPTELAPVTSDDPT